MLKAQTAFRSLVLGTALAAAGAGHAYAQLAPEALKQAEQNFKAANASGSGSLSAAEFKTFVDLNAAAQIGRAGKIKANDAYSRAFAKVDANKDGAISWQEYLAAQ